MEYRWGDRELSPTFLDLALDTAHVGPSSAGQEHLDAHDPAENNAATAKEPEDIDMADLGTNNRKIPEAEDDSSTPKVNLQQQPHPKAHGRSKYKGLDWDTHKPMMKTLYMDKDMSLTDTMGVMERECSFKASQKAYKEQFDSWQWKKKLPKEIAQYMVEKDKKRKRQGKKGTVYKWGGRKWTGERAKKSFTRSKAGNNPPEVMPTLRTVSLTEPPRARRHPLMRVTRTTTLQFKTSKARQTRSRKRALNLGAIQMSLRSTCHIKARPGQTYLLCGNLCGLGAAKSRKTRRRRF